MSGNMHDLICHAIWGKLTPIDAKQFSIDLEAALGTPPQCWQGFRETDIFLWTVTVGSPGPFQLPEIDPHLHQRTFNTLRRWGEPAAQLKGAANFVLREINPRAIDELMPQLLEHMESVVAQPGCKGSYLGVQDGAPSNLLGITYWQDTVYFERYMRWAIEHHWRDIITPVTLDVPLRLFTRRVQLGRH